MKLYTNYNLQFWVFLTNSSEYFRNLVQNLPKFLMEFVVYLRTSYIQKKIALVK